MDSVRADNISLRDAIRRKSKPTENGERPDTETNPAAAAAPAASASRPPSEAVYEATDDIIYEETDIDGAANYERLGRRAADPGSGSGRTYQSLFKDRPKRNAAAAAPDYRANRKHR